MLEKVYTYMNNLCKTCALLLQDKISTQCKRMDFLKTGFNLVDTNELNLDKGTKDMISALMILFIEDVTTTAIKYVITQDRKEITACDMKKCLKYQAQNFFNQDETLEQRYTTMMQELQEEESDEEDEGEEGEEYEGEEGEEYEGEEEESEEDDTPPPPPEPELVIKVDDAESQWENWNPTDPVLSIIKRSIDRINIDS